VEILVACSGKVGDEWAGKSIEGAHSYECAAFSCASLSMRVPVRVPARVPVRVPVRAREKEIRTEREKDLIRLS
jgi:hypothetical protein